MAQEKTYDIFISEYERGLLSLAFRYIDLLTVLQQRITDDYFLSPPHKVIYIALGSLLRQPQISKIDLESLCIECNKLGFSELGINSEYLVLLAQGGYDRDNFDFYYDKVKNAYLKYTLQQEIEDAYRTVRSNAGDEENNLTGKELIEKTSARLATILSGMTDSESEAINVSEYVEEFLKKVKDDPTEVRGIRTGFDNLDVSINGLLPGTLTIVAGRAGDGKSTTLLNMANHIAVENDDRLPVLIISTEMSTDEDLSRLLAMRTLLEERKIINGNIGNDPEFSQVLSQAAAELQQASIFHLYLPEFNADQICNIIYQYKLKHNIGVAFFDYIKMDTVGENLKNKREDQILGDLTTKLKNTAGRLRIPIVAACQINNNSGRIADSDRIRRYCNNLIEFFPKSREELDEQDYHKFGTHWFKTLKVRSGGFCKIPVRFWKKCLKLEEADFFNTSDDGDETAEETRVLTTPREYMKKMTEQFKIENAIDITQQRYDDYNEDGGPI